MIDNRGFEKEGDGSSEFLKGSCAKFIGMLELEYPVPIQSLKNNFALSLSLSLSLSFSYHYKANSILVLINEICLRGKLRNFTEKLTSVANSKFENKTKNSTENWFGHESR